MDDHAMDDEKSLNKDHNNQAMNNGKRARGRPFQRSVLRRCYPPICRESAEKVGAGGEIFH